MLYRFLGVYKHRRPSETKHTLRNTLQTPAPLWPAFRVLTPALQDAEKSTFTSFPHWILLLVRPSDVSEHFPAVTAQRPPMSAALDKSWTWTWRHGPYLLEGHPEGTHVDIGCYSAGVQVAAAAQDHTWREGKDVCQTARQLLLCEMRRSQGLFCCFVFVFTHAVKNRVKL